MIKRALLLLLLTAVWAFGSWWYYTCMIKGFCRVDGTFTSAADRAKTLAATGAAATVAAATNGITDTEQSGDDTGNQSSDTSSADNNDSTTEQDATTESDSNASNPTDSASDDSAPESSDDDTSSDNNANSDGDKPTADTPTTTTEFIDQDNDAISDEDERRLGTDPAKDDSDGDGVKDNEELGTDLQNPTDTDNDGIIDALDDDDDNDTLSTAQEKSLGTNPRNPDTDDDALNDALEANNEKIGTDPLNPDTDGDGITDGSEVGSEPNKPMDSDKDGIIDALDEDDDNDGVPSIIETQIGSDPLNTDSDGDGVSDGDEIGDNPQQPKDSDGDGIIDLIDSDSGKAEQPEGTANTAEGNDGNEQTDASANQPKDDSQPKDDNQVTVSTNEGAAAASGSGNIPIQKSRLYFPSRSSNPGLSEAATKYFQQVASWLNASPSHTVVLTGHTDNVGKAKTNLDLGLKRAIEIKNIMVKLGANASQIDVASMGETQPIASNKTDSGRRKNRRVELIPALKQ